MRCLACDQRLNNRESTRKYSSSGTFVDLCDHCFSTISEDVPDIDSSGGGDDYPGEEQAFDATDMEGLGFNTNGEQDGSF